MIPWFFSRLNVTLSRKKSKWWKIWYFGAWLCHLRARRAQRAPTPLRKDPTMSRAGLIILFIPIKKTPAGTIQRLVHCPCSARASKSMMIHIMVIISIYIVGLSQPHPRFDAKFYPEFRKHVFIFCCVVDTWSSLVIFFWCYFFSVFLQINSLLKYTFKICTHFCPSPHKYELKVSVTHQTVCFRQRALISGELPMP